MTVFSYDLQPMLSNGLRDHVVDTFCNGQSRDDRKRAGCQLLWAKLHQTPNNVLELAQICATHDLMKDSPILRPGWLDSIRALGGTPQIAQSDDYTPPGEAPGLQQARESVLWHLQKLDEQIFNKLVLSEMTNEDKGIDVQQFSATTDNEPILLSINLPGLPKPLDPTTRRKLESQSVSGTTNEQREALVRLKLGEMTTADKVYATADTLANVFDAMPKDDPLLRVKYEFGKSGTSKVSVYRSMDADFRAGLNRVVAAMCKMSPDALRSLNIGEGADPPADQFSTDGDNGATIFEAPKTPRQIRDFEAARLRAASRS